jgi:hypothetical protein
VHRARPEVIPVDLRPERQFTRGNGDGARRTERVGAAVQGGEVGGDQRSRHDGDEDGAEPQEHGAR